MSLDDAAEALEKNFGPGFGSIETANPARDRIVFCDEFPHMRRRADAFTHGQLVDVVNGKDDAEGTVLTKLRAKVHRFPGSLGEEQGTVFVIDVEQGGGHWVDAACCAAILAPETSSPTTSPSVNDQDDQKDPDMDDGTDMTETKAKLWNLSEEDSLVQTFATELAKRMNDQLLPEGLNVTVELLLHDCRAGKSGFPHLPLPRSLTGQPPVVYAILAMNVERLVRATCPPDFAERFVEVRREVRRMVEDARGLTQPAEKIDP